MSTQSGIQVSETLLARWGDLVHDSDVSAIEIKIENDSTLEITRVLRGADGFGEVSALVAEEPSYFLVRHDGKWIFYSYIPDTSRIRSKMLYASTRATLIKSLGESSFADALFATSKDEISESSYESHLKHKDAPPPLTEREAEIENIKKLDRELKSDQIEPSASTSMAWNSLHTANKWSDEAKSVVEGLAQSDYQVVVFDVSEESQDIGLREAGGSELLQALPSDKPSFALYRLSKDASKYVAVYLCPSGCKVKLRMIYSSSFVYWVNTLRSLNLDIIKKLEFSEASDISSTHVEEEVSHLLEPTEESGETTQNATNTASMPLGESAPISRKSRPPRRKK